MVKRFTVNHIRGIVFSPVQMASVLVGKKYEVYDKTKLEEIIQRLRA